jgi:hypothetical protein
MKDFDKVGKTTRLLTGIFTFLVIAIMFVTMLANVDFNISQINWFDFTFSLFNYVAARVIYFPVGIEIANKEESISLLSTTINRYRNIIYKKKINKEFREKIEKYNKIAKANAYIDLIDNKLSAVKNKQKLLYWNDLKVKMLELMPFLEKGDLTGYKGSINIDSVRIKYDKLEFGNIFSFGVAIRKIGEKYEFNAGAEGVNRSYIEFIFTALISFLNASLVVLQYGFTILSLYMFFYKIIMFMLGANYGIKIGKEVILESKYVVMLNLADRTKEILTELEKELNTVLDDGNV